MIHDVGKSHAMIRMSAPELAPEPFQSSVLSREKPVHPFDQHCVSRIA
jgi:hypothetical protein